MNSYLDVVAAYDGQADMLVERYEAVSSEHMLAHVLPVIPDGSDSKLALDVAPAQDVTRPG